MSVTSTRIVEDTLSGTAQGPTRTKALRSYQMSHMVLVDDAIPDPSTVLNHFERTRTLPYPGRAFELGVAVDKQTPCRRLEVTYIKGSGQSAGGWFKVDSFFERYAPLPPDEIDVTFTQYTVAAETGIFRGAQNAIQGSLSGGRVSPVLKINTLAAITNSAGASFDPSIEEEVDVKVIRITKGVPTYDDQLFNYYQTLVNTDDVTINRPDLNFKTSFGPLTGRIKLIGGTMVIDQEESISWRQTIEIHVNKLGWRKRILDQGTHTTEWTWENGTAVSTQIREKDADDFPITTPVLLDGNGKKLDVQKRKPVYLVWSTYNEGPFMPLKGKAW